MNRRQRQEAVPSGPPSKALDPWTKIEFECPGAALLAIKHEIGLGDFIGLEQRIRSTLLSQWFIAWRADLTVYDDMGHVNTLGSELACHALRDSPECEFRRCQVDETRSAPEGSGGAGENDRALPDLDHPPRRLTSDQEAREAPDPPASLELRGVGFADRTPLISADIEDDEPRDAENALGMVEEFGDLARGSSVTVI